MTLKELLDARKFGKSNGQRKAYNHLMETGIFGVADKVKEFRKNDRKRYNRRNKR